MNNNWKYKTRAKYNQQKNLFWSAVWKLKSFDSLEELFSQHFQRWSIPDHQNRQGMFIALKELSQKPSIIVESGTSAYGIDSSRLFDSYVRSFGGEFYSVDIDPSPSKNLKFAKSKNSHFYVMDSVKFLKLFQNYSGEEFADLIYLDSLDVDWSSPLKSSEHGEKEIMAVRPLLKSGTVVVVDDTPSTLNWIPKADWTIATNFLHQYGVLPGKGAFYLRALEGIDFSVLYHDYNLVIRINEI